MRSGYFLFLKGESILRVKFLKNKILVFSLSFLSLFSFGSITQFNNASASESDQVSENVDENPDEIQDQNNEDEIGGDPNNEGINEADDQNFDDPHEEIPEENEQYSQDSEQPPVDEKYESGDKVDLGEKLGEILDKNEDVVIDSHDGTPERTVRKLSKQKVRDLVKLRRKDKSRKDRVSKDYSVVSEKKGLSNAGSSKNDELFEGLNRSGVEFFNSFDILEKVLFPIHVDCIVPLCTSSRPFLFSYMFGLKPVASPLDLVSRCSLKKIIGFFENNFADFFVDIRRARQKVFSETFCIRDLKNKLCSSYFFEKDVSFKLAKRGFCSLKEFYLSRMHSILEKSDSIGLICDGHYPSSSLINFAKRFSNLYPDKTIILMNVDVIRKIDGGIHISSPFANDKLKVVQFIVSERNINKWDGIAYCIDAGQKRELKK